MAVVIVILLVVVFFQWMTITDLKWWRDYYSKRRDAEAKLNRQLLEKFCGISSDAGDNDEEEEWQEVLWRPSAPRSQMRKGSFECS
jgi:hypothetical protein